MLMVFMISITTISAADLNDAGDVLNDGDKSFDDLNKAITVENSNFNFNGDYKFNQGTDKDYSDGINITKNNFVINGNNHIIDCANQARAFYITGKNVEINNLIIQNAFCGYGSAIGTDSKLTLNNVTFINCMGDNETYDGGAVYSLDAVLNVNNCKFIDNSGDNGASITSFRSEVNVVNSTFTSSSDNIIKGQIFLDMSNLTVDNSNFLNTTSKYAAAIFSRNDGKLIISNSKFKNLFANKTAGAIGARIISNLTITGCEFDNVASENDGGAIFVDVFAGDSVFGSWTTISNTLFNNCYSGFGGAILQLDGNLIINNTNFTSNTANYEGGAIYTSHANVEIQNSKFISNSIGDDKSYGGACYFDSDEALLKGNTFVNNSAFEGSAVYAYDNELTLIGNYFNNPSDGISVYTVYGKVNRDLDNNYTSDVKSFNNKNDFYNWESNAKPLIILNSNITYDKMPEFFDLRKYGWITPVKDQGFMGACWAFGNVAALESALLRYTNQTYSLSENNMQNTMLKYSKYSDDVLSEGGNAFTAVAYLIDWLGIFPAEYDSYDEMGKISSLYMTPEDIHIQNVVVIPPVKDAAGRDLIKNALINYGAVAASHRADFNKTKYFNESNSAQYCYDANESTHRICIVGWDDNYSRNNFLKTPEGDGAWICKNSWGTGWGDKGYFYLSYYDTSFADKESVCYIINNDTYTRIYQNDVGGDSKLIPEGNYYASVFTAEDDEIIGAVGIFFNKSGAEYEFTVSVNDADVHTQKGISKISGYETVNLNKPVPIKKGDTFKITFKNTPYVTNNLRIPSQPGKSFISDDGKEWEDLSKVHFIAILKAYAVPKLDTTIASEDVYGYSGEKVNIIANVTDENGNPVSNGTAILIIGDKIGEAPEGFAAAGEYVANVENGKAVFEGLMLPDPGVYPVDLMYLGDDAYNPSNTTVNMVVVNRVNTTISADPVNGNPSDKINVTVNVIDEDGNPVLNGTTTLIIDGVEYTAEVHNGIARFIDVILPKSSTTAIVKYNGNEYYAPSESTFDININATESEQNNTISQDNGIKKSVNNSIDSKQAGNPILVVLLALMCLVSNNILRRKR